MTSSPRLILPTFSWFATPPRRPTSSRSRASISAGPVLGSRISSSPHSTLTATRPPSLTTATTGTEVPVVPSSRHRPRAAARSVRTAAQLSFDPWVSIHGCPFVTHATHDRYNEIEIKASGVDHPVVGKVGLEATLHSVDLTETSWLIGPDAKLPVGELESRI